MWDEMYQNWIQFLPFPKLVGSIHHWHQTAIGRLLISKLTEVSKYELQKCHIKKKNNESFILLKTHP